MPGKKAVNGDCYICGANLGKLAMKTHILKNHNEEKDGEKCCLLKIEGRYDNGYWLYIDVPVEETLLSVDDFLREIWLECCGHLSQFRRGNRDELSDRLKLERFAPGDKFFHLYDFGSTTETAITVIGNTLRKPQKETVRLLARNSPNTYQCDDCGKKAAYLAEEFEEPYETRFFCEECVKKYDDGNHALLPVTNSPRMGVCGYGGELDRFEFKPELIQK